MVAALAHVLSISKGLYDMSGNVAEWTNDWYGSQSRAAEVSAGPGGLERLHGRPTAVAPAPGARPT